MCSVSEHAKLHAAITVLQFGYAGNHILMRMALNSGISKLVFLIYRTTIALVLLSPLAYFLEKKDRPALNASFVMQFFLLGFVGVVSVQGLYITGLDNTSPILASAMENAVPAITFLLAAIFRIEQVNLNRKDGVAKVLGTLSCAAGASVITFYKGPAFYMPEEPSQHQSISILGNAEGKNWIFGCICLIVRCLSYSSWTIFQGSVVKRYPARITVSSFTFFFGLLQFLAFVALLERDPHAWKIQSKSAIISLFYAGIVPSALGFSIMIWVVDRGGPILATAYMPLQTLLVSIMASVVLNEEFYFGSIIGSVLILVGLYLVVWGKIEETKFNSEEEVIPSIKESSQAANHMKSLIDPFLPECS